MMRLVYNNNVVFYTEINYYKCTILINNKLVLTDNGLQEEGYE